MTFEEFGKAFQKLSGLGDADEPAEVARGSTLAESEIHGMKHWLQVLGNGLWLVDKEGFDNVQRAYARSVVYYFALYHDCMREDEDECQEHGIMAGIRLKNRSLTLKNSAKAAAELAVYACMVHTAVKYSKNSPLLQVGSSPGIHNYDETLSESQALMVGLCLDADRLDLGRVGITPHYKYLYTRAARAWVMAPGYDPEEPMTWEIEQQY